VTAVATIGLRPATPDDQERIVEIVRAAQINPIDLKWPNFVVAVDESTDEIVGTGQVKPHGDGTWELASIATLPAYQKQGIAGRIIERLLARHPGTLYLTCMQHMGPFYERFGFREVPRGEMTPYFRRLSKLASLFMFVGRPGERMLVMKRDG
jgi:N-acetylglutamate synthase-like GNAT family acetyltransferase